ncbi:MAG: VWA domain-containing protein [Rhodobacteraceae bacterium]|nr:VWA domain-containing protein [Paracoccaceae bacterium]
MWSLTDPIALLLAPLPLLFMRWRSPERAEGGAMRAPPSVVDRLEAAGAASGRRAMLAPLALPWLIWGCLLLALSGPQKLDTARGLPASSRDVMMVLDLSGSMERSDFSLDGVTARRLDVVKQVGGEFVRRRAGDRVGLVIFGDRSFVAASLSHDVESIAQTLEAATIGVAGRSTAISDGVGLALRRLERSEAASKVIVLLSDGIDTARSVAPRDAARLAGELGVRIHTLSLGPRDLSDGGDIRDVVDAETLSALAEISGGESWRVRNTSDLQDAIEAIDVLEGSLMSTPPAEIRQDYWTWPAGLALMLSLALMAIDRGIWL